MVGTEGFEPSNNLPEFMNVHAFPLSYVPKGGMTILQSFAATHGSYKKAQKGKPYSLSFSRLIKQMNFSATFIFCIAIPPKIKNRQR